MHRLEAALAVAAPGRERSWRDDVLAALATLESVMATEYDNAEQPDSLLSDIKRTQPRLRSQVRGLRMQYGHLRDAIAALRVELTTPDDQPGPVPDFGDIRQRLAWLLMALRHHRARESDLLYEAYFDAFRTNLEPE